MGTQVIFPVKFHIVQAHPQGYYLTKKNQAQIFHYMKPLHVVYYMVTTRVSKKKLGSILITLGE